MTTRKRIKHSSTGNAGGGGGGGQQGGDTVTLGPEFGESNTPSVGVAASWNSLTLGPFAAPAVGATASFSQMTLGPFSQLSAGASTKLESLSLGPFAAPIVGVSAAGTLTANGLNASRDVYLDEASSSTNFGSANPLLAKTNAAVGNNRQITYIAWDLTGYSGTTITSATMDLTLQTTGLTNENAPYNIFTHTSAPFVEGTATWANTEPPPGTSRQTGTVQATTGGYTTQTITLNSTVRTNAPGNWLYIRINGATALGLATIQTRSKEHATNTERPRLNLQVTL